MLWYKAWLDTRWRFLLGLALLLVFACGTVDELPDCARARRLVEPERDQRREELRQEIRKSRSSSCGRFGATRGRNGSQQNFLGLLTIFAALLGSGSPLVKSRQRRAVLAGAARVARPLDRGARGSGARRALRARARAQPRDRGARAVRRRAIRRWRSARLRPVRVRRGERVVRRRGVLLDAVQRRLAAAVADVRCCSGDRRGGTGVARRHGLFTAMAGGKLLRGRLAALDRAARQRRRRRGLVYAAAANVARRDF